MKLMNAKELIEDAYRNNYSVAAMNANGATYDIARAIIESADEEDLPVIIQAYEHNINYRGYEYFVLLVKHLAENSKVPYAITLDHGNSIKSIMQAVKAGFTGVMMDNTEYTLEENIKRTQELIKYVKPVGVSVEAEVGHMAQAEKPEAGTFKSDIREVEIFLNEVDADLLAVSVGTSHGYYKEQKMIDFDLIKKIHAMTGIPLVMHGTCGIPLELITKLVKCGMRKINFGEAFRMNYIKYFNELSTGINHKGHAWKVMEEVKNRLKADIKAIFKAINKGL
ncbi:MAG: class II fructose-bisphosphate aldolase [Spirochaetes bacterium]|nr:class II fructose-bisphosphate aldolase [Spirochaetota bacterium]